MAKILVMKEIAQILCFDAGIGEYEFTVKVTDAYGATAVILYQLK